MHYGEQGRPGTDSGKSHIKCHPLWRGRQISGSFSSFGRKYVYIDISDKGKGIDKAFSTRIFDRLFTLEDSRNQEIQGNGLGLTIAKSLANQLGGDILLKSDPHILTTFTLKFRKLIY